jgi:hypothetical protein
MSFQQYQTLSWILCNDKHENSLSPLGIQVLSGYMWLENLLDRGLGGILHVIRDAIVNVIWRVC